MLIGWSIRDWNKRITADQARATFEHSLRLDQEFGASFTGQCCRLNVHYDPRSSRSHLLTDFCHRLRTYGGYNWKLQRCGNRRCGPQCCCSHGPPWPVVVVMYGSHKISLGKYIQLIGSYCQLIIASRIERQRRLKVI